MAEKAKADKKAEQARFSDGARVFRLPKSLSFFPFGVGGAHNTASLLPYGVQEGSKLESHSRVTSPKIRDRRPYTRPFLADGAPAAVLGASHAQVGQYLEKSSMGPNP